MPEARLIVSWPFEDRTEEVHEVAPGVTLAEALMAASPDRWGGCNFEVFYGSITAETAVPVQDAPDVVLKDGEVWHVTVVPAEAFTITAAITALTAYVGTTAATIIVYAATMAISMAISFAASMLLAPGKTGDKSPAPADQPTSTNSLSPPRNMMRPASRIPEIFGTMRVWPDLLFPAWSEWRVVDDNSLATWTQPDKLNVVTSAAQDVTAVYCLGRGAFDIGDFRFGDADISTVQGAVYHYPPGSTLPPHIRLPRAVGNLSRVEFPAVSTGNPYLPWMRVPGDAVSAIWIQVHMPGGGYLTISDPKGPTPPFNYYPTAYEFQVVIERLVNGAVAERHVHIFSRPVRTGNELRETLKWEGLTPGAWQVTVGEISTHEPPKLVAHRKSSLEGIVGFERIADTHRTFTDETVLIVTASNRGGTATQNLENFNCIVTRHLPMQDWNAPPGTLAPRAPTTEWFAAAAWTLLDPQTCGYEWGQVDWSSMLDVHAALHTAGEGEFCAVVDRQMSADEQLQLIAHKARAQVFMSHGKVTFARDQRRPGVSALFNRRNRMLDKGATGLGLRFPGPDDHDAVEIQWMDRDNDWKQRTFTWPEGITPRNAKKMDLIGATRWPDVYRRARYEFALERFRRRSQPLRVTEEAQLLMPFDRVSVVDPWSEGVVDGEVLEVRGNLLRLDRPVPSITSDARIRFRRTDGRETSLHTFTVAQHLGETWIELLPPLPGMGIVGPNADRQLGSLYNISLHDAAEKATQWIVSGFEVDAQGVTLSLMDDDDRIYQESDDVAVPPNPPLMQTY